MSYQGLTVYVDSFFMMFYGGAMVTAILACIYLLFRRSNAFFPDVTPPLRLRRWVAAFFAVMALSHLHLLLLLLYCIHYFTPSRHSAIILHCSNYYMYASHNQTYRT